MKTHEELEEIYLENDANHCPYCESPNISGGDTDFDCTHAFRNVVCKNCGKEWAEVFEITGVIFKEEES